MSTTKLGYVHSITKIISLGLLNVLSLQKSINPTGFEKIPLYCTAISQNTAYIVCFVTFV